jgi:hypothetical protein
MLHISQHDQPCRLVGVTTAWHHSSSSFPGLAHGFATELQTWPKTLRTFHIVVAFKLSGAESIDTFHLPHLNRFREHACVLEQLVKALEIRCLLVHLHCLFVCVAVAGSEHVQ